MKRVLELTLKYIDDTIAEEEIAELETLLDGDEEAVRYHVSLLEQEGVLLGAHTGRGLTEPTLAKIRAALHDRVEDGVMKKIHPAKDPSVSDETVNARPAEPVPGWLGGPRFWRVFGSVAALLVLIVGLYTAHMATRTAGPAEAVLYGQETMTPGVANAYRAYVRNGETDEPIAGAEVTLTLLNTDRESVWESAEVVSDARGIANIDAEIPEILPDGRYLLKLEVDSDDGEARVLRPVTLERAFRVLVTTDKPLYQPGQPIRMRALALSTANLRPVAGSDLLLEVFDGKGNKVFKKALKTSDFGVASADFELADQVNMGAYRIAATVGEVVSERTVNVKRYVLPKFRIDLKTEKGFYTPGDVAGGDLVATYTFGKPVTGAKVKVVASRFIEEFHPFATAEGTTDADGRFTFKVPLRDYFAGHPLKQGDAFVSLEATVIDDAGHTLKKSADLTVTMAPIRIDIIPESGTLVQNVVNHLYIVTAYPDGRPAQTSLTIGAGKSKIKTSLAGIAKVKITPTQATEKLTVQAVDAQGFQSTVSRRISAGEKTDAFLLRTDRAIYRSGETAELKVISAKPGGRILLDVVQDRRTVLMKAIDVTDGTGELALDLPEDLFGTVQLHAYRFDDGAIVSDTKIIQVRRADDLKITAELDKATYRPAESALLKFLVTRADGEPTQAALALAGVDEAVFALHEMRPGLERIYFTLQEELLKPKFEIHAPLSTTPSEAIEPEPVPLGEPEPEIEEASVILFASAEGTAPPAPGPGETFEQKKTRYRAERDDFFKWLATVGVFIPFGLFFLLIFPLFHYRIRSVASKTTPATSLRKPVEIMAALWVAGLVLPAFASLIEALPRYYLSGIVGMAVFFAMVCTALKIRQAAMPNNSPVFGHAIKSLPAAYLCAILSVLLILVASDKETGLVHWKGPWWIIPIIAITCTAVAAALTGWVSASFSHVSTGKKSAERKPEPIRILVELLLISFAVIFIVALLWPATLDVGVDPSVGSREQTANFEGRASAPSARPLPDNAPDLESPKWRLPRLAHEPYDRPAGPPEKVQPEGGSELKLQAPQRVRRHFPETLIWRPEIITDADGTAQLEIPLADSITTWRLATSAISRDGKLGAGSVPLRVFQDFFIDIDFPATLTQNDVVHVPVAVFNYLDKPQTVRLDLAPGDWYQLKGDATHTLAIAPQSLRSVYFPIVATRPGRHALTVKAHGTALADAVERSVLVEPDGERVDETFNGQLGDNVTQRFTIPADAVAGANDLVVKIYPGAFSQVVEGLDSIFRMPHGCFEQTSSTTYPNVLVLDYMKRTGQTNPELEAKALKYISHGYQRLLTFEVDGGGFDWYGQAPGDTRLTAYGLMEFTDMSRVFDVDPDLIARTRNRLLSQQNADGSWNGSGRVGRGTRTREAAQVRTTAYIAWGLAQSGETGGQMGKTLDYLAQRIGNTDDSYTLALIANALGTGGQKAKATAALKKLDGLKNETDDTVFWSSTGESVTYSRGDVLAIETTALAIQAYQAADYAPVTVGKALTWLIERKDARGTWHSTQATIFAMQALLAGINVANGPAVDLQVTVAVNGKHARDLTITPADSDVFRLISLRDFVRMGENHVTLEVAGKGSVAYQVVATHYKPWSGERRPVAKALSITQRYDTTRLRAQDTLTCRVTVRYNRPGVANMTIVDLGIPPGFALNPDGFDRLVRDGVIERYEVSGGRVIVYFRQIAGDRPVTFDYALRAQYPVRVKSPAATVYQYYEPALRDRTVPVELTVR